MWPRPGGLREAQVFKRKWEKMGWNILSTFVFWGEIVMKFYQVTCFTNERSLRAMCWIQGVHTISLGGFRYVFLWMIARQNVFMTRAPLYNSAGIRLGAWEARQVVGKAMVMCGLVVKPTVQRTKWGFLGMIINKTKNIENLNLPN